MLRCCYRRGLRPVRYRCISALLAVWRKAILWSVLPSLGLPNRDRLQWRLEPTPAWDKRSRNLSVARAHTEDALVVGGRMFLITSLQILKLTQVAELSALAVHCVAVCGRKRGVCANAVSVAAWRTRTCAWPVFADVFLRIYCALCRLLASSCSTQATSLTATKVMCYTRTVGMICCTNPRRMMPWAPRWSGSKND